MPGTGDRGPAAHRCPPRLYCRAVTTHRLVLFDIDGTLLSSQGMPARILGDALREVFGTSGPTMGVEYAGRTDPQIARDLMSRAGVPRERIAALLGKALDRYTELLAERLPPEAVEAKPGVVALVEALAARPEVTLALLTGNLEPCARVKLGPLGLNRFFPFGAFGSDDEDRYRLPALAVARARERTGRIFQGPEVVVVGDSVHDVLCGRSLGVRAVAVATGPMPRPALEASGPDALLDDFSDTERSLLAILDGAPAPGQAAGA